MELKDILSIGASVFISVFGSVATWFITTRQLREEFKSKKFDLQSDFAKILLEERIKRYPELWKIISNIYWEKKMKWISDITIAVQRNKECRMQIREWRKENWIFLSNINHEIVFKDSVDKKEKMSLSSLRALQELEDALFLKKNYSSYDEYKMRKLDKYRNLALNTMRKDIDIIEASSNSVKLEMADEDKNKGIWFIIKQNLDKILK